MLPPLLDSIARFALSVSSQVVIVAVLIAGILVVVADSDTMLVLALLTSYLATAVLLATFSAPELSFAIALTGILVAVMMQFTAAERRNPAAKNRISVTFRVLVIVIVFWIVWSLGLFSPPVDPSSIASTWLLASSVLVLATSTDSFKTGTALLMIISASLLVYAGSTSEASLLVLGLTAVSAFAVSLATSHLALANVPEVEE